MVSQFLELTSISRGMLLPQGQASQCTLSCLAIPLGRLHTTGCQGAAAESILRTSPSKNYFKLSISATSMHNSPPAGYGKLIFNSLTSPATLQHSKQQNGSVLWVTGSSLGCQSSHLAMGRLFPAQPQHLSRKAAHSPRARVISDQLPPVNTSSMNY